MKKRRLIAIAAAIAVAIPLWAVFQEKSMHDTLDILLYELREAHSEITRRNTTSKRRVEAQHQVLVNLVDQCNELSLMLYSQPQNFTFDLTYALNQVTSQYEAFDKRRMPFDQIIQSMQVEVERNSKLAQTLRNMPPVRRKGELTEPVVETVMDSINVVVDTLMSNPEFIHDLDTLKLAPGDIALRDSCLVLAEAMVDYYWDTIHRIETDSRYYSETDAKLKEAYDYAQNRFKQVQRSVFLEGERNYVQIIKRFRMYFARASRDAASRYGMESYRKSGTFSAWRGPIVISYAIAMLVIMILAIFLSYGVARLGLKHIRYFQTPTFQERKTVILALTGVFFFAVILGINIYTMSNPFVSLSSRRLAEFAWLLAAILLSLTIRLRTHEECKNALVSYLPTFTLAFIVVFFRTVFIPNSIINLAFPPLVLLFTIWQILENIHRQKRVPKTDIFLLWISAAVMAVCTVIAFYGLSMMALLILIWWLFQLSIIQSVTAISIIFDRHYSKHVKEREQRYRENYPQLPRSGKKGSYIEVSWLHDLVNMTILPVFSLWSLPLAIQMACKVFDLTGTASDVFFKPIIHWENYIELSLFKMVLVISLFFLFRYGVYATKAFYRVGKTRKAISKLGEGVVFKESDINFNLANNLITLLYWGLFVIICFAMLQIPTSALTIITTGLATGIGFAMKDVLNNFFYGVQLMSGRVRVGDIVECDGIRGTVQSLSYQSTNLEAVDGSVIAFTNTALFNKNFKNLTRNHSYELLSFTVGVKYGTDVQKARETILKALEPLMTKDKYGREIVDRKKGVQVRLLNFGDSSVDLQTVLYTTVETHYTFAAQAREAIYKAFADAGIEIPFPQQDLYIKETPQA